MHARMGGVVVGVCVWGDVGAVYVWVLLLLCVCVRVWGCCWCVYMRGGVGGVSVCVGG